MYSLRELATGQSETADPDPYQNYAIALASTQGKIIDS
jgi:hypothetical protein